MDIADALQIVIDLAKQNVVNESEMPDEHERQIEARLTAIAMTLWSATWSLLNLIGG